MDEEKDNDEKWYELQERIEEALREMGTLTEEPSEVWSFVRQIADRMERELDEMNALPPPGPIQ
jgi:hypothetical protein